MKAAARFLQIPSLVLLVLSAPLAFCQTPKDFGQAIDLQFIEDLHTIQRKEAEKPLEELNSKYRAALEKYRTDFQAAGNLDGVLQAQRALDEIAQGRLPDGKSSDAMIEKYEAVYLKQRAAVAKAAEESLRKADRDYIALLDELSIRLTKSGKIEEAIKVREVSEKAKAGLSSAETKKEITQGGQAVVKILSARYGTGGTYADVTAKVKEMVEDKRESFWASPQIFGGDPVPYYNKSVNVRYTKDGITRDRWWGREVPLRVEDFYGPQDKEETRRWLTGTKWKSPDAEISFNSDQTFVLTNRLGTYQWTAEDVKKILMVWATSDIVPCIFDDTWSSFTEQSGKKRTFRKAK